MSSSMLPHLGFTTSIGLMFGEQYLGMLLVAVAVALIVMLSAKRTLKKQNDDI